MKNLVVIVSAFFLVLGCEDENHIPKPDPIMEEAQYLDLLLELKTLKTYQSRGATGSVVDSLYTEIFTKHNADTSLFRKSHEYYQTQVVQQQKRVDSLVVRLNHEMEAFHKMDSLKTQSEDINE